MCQMCQMPHPIEPKRKSIAMTMKILYGVWSTGDSPIIL